MFTSSFVGEFCESPYQVFKDQSHVGIAHSLGMKVYASELLDDLIKQVAVVQLLYLFEEVVPLEDVPAVVAERIDVRLQVLLDVCRVAKKLLEIEL